MAQTAGVQGFGQGMGVDGGDAEMSHPDPKLNAIQQILNQTQRDMTVEEVKNCPAASPHDLSEDARPSTTRV